MFCNKCGAQIPDGTKFCNKCGAPVGGANPAPANGPAANPAPANNAAPANGAVPPVPPMQQPVNGMPMQQPMNGMPMNGMMPPKKPVNKKLIIGICSAVAVIAIAVVAIILILNIKPKVNLNSYVDAEFSGYDTVGTADVEVDTDAIVKKYGKKIKGTDALKKYKKENYFFGGDDMTDAEIFAEMVEDACYVDRTSYLSNGDKIEISWDKDDIKEIKKCFKVELQFKDFEVEVKDLDEAEEFDPFKDLEVTFKGTSGDGYAELSYNGDLDIDFYASPNYDLEEGDTITVYTYASKDQFLREGKLLTETEKDYTVEGLSTYVTKLSQIPSSELSKLQSKAEDVVENGNKDYYNYLELADYELAGTYFLTSKNNYSSYNNLIYFVYEVTFNSTENDKYNDIKFYYVVRFQDGLINPDGDFSIDYEDYYVPYNYFYVDYDKGTWDYCSVYGYESLDDFEEDNIEYYSDDYNVEKDIKTDVDTDENSEEEEPEEEEEN